MVFEFDSLFGKMSNNGCVEKSCFLGKCLNVLHFMVSYQNFVVN